MGGWLQLQGCVSPPMDWRRSPLAATTLSSSSSGPTYLCFSSQVPWLPWKWVEEPITVVQWIVINCVWVFVMWVAFIIWKYVFVFLCVLLLCGGCTWSVCCAQYSLLESTIGAAVQCEGLHCGECILFLSPLSLRLHLYITRTTHIKSPHMMKKLSHLWRWWCRCRCVCMINDHYGVEEKSVWGKHPPTNSDDFFYFFQTRLGTRSPDGDDH